NHSSSTPPSSGPIAPPTEKLVIHTETATVRCRWSRNMLRISDRVEGARLRDQTAGLLAACAAAGPGGRLVAIGDRRLTVSMVTVTGAMEITVHGRDISAASRMPRPRPASAAPKPGRGARAPACGAGTTKALTGPGGPFIILFPTGTQG